MTVRRTRRGAFGQGVAVNKQTAPDAPPVAALHDSWHILLQNSMLLLVQFRIELPAFAAPPKVDSNKLKIIEPAQDEKDWGDGLDKGGEGTAERAEKYCSIHLSKLQLR